MKKILVSLLVLALCAPAMADVTFTVDTSTAGQATISYTCTEAAGPVGIALNVDADDPADEIDGISGIDSFFDIFVDFAFDEEDTGDGYTYAEGSTTASNAITYQTSAGVAPLPSNSFAICIAGLGGDAEPLDDSPTSATVAVLTGDPGDYTLTLNGTRAGVVDKNGTMTTNLPLSFTIAPAVTDCITSADTDYTDWVNLGKPDSWCNKRQCHGDADGLENNFGTQPPPIVPWPKSWVTVEDLNILIAGYKDTNYVDEATDPWIAADFDRRSNTFGTQPPPIVPWPAARVTVEDLNILIGNYKATSGINEDCNQ